MDVNTEINRDFRKEEKEKKGDEKDETRGTKIEQ